MAETQKLHSEMDKFVERKVSRQLASAMRAFPFRPRRPKESYARYEKSKLLHWAFRRKMYTVEAQQNWIKNDFNKQNKPRRKLRTRRR